MGKTMKFFIQYEGNEKVYGANTNPFDLFFEENDDFAKLELI